MQNFDTVLIANRGEIACRIIRSAQKSGLRTVAVYSEADRGAPHTQLADEAICIGAGPSAQSYLLGDRIIEAAQKSGAQAIHPGYGFLSENAGFAEAVEAAGLVFVGPDARSIRLMGDKAAAKIRMIEAGVPCVPGYQEADQSDETLIAAAQKIGFPVMVKATAGGGGRGMRLVHEALALPDALGNARSEAVNAFGDGTLILERAVVAPRHVEVQVFADTHGNVIHLGERDCSVQRRHQKVVEEAPCPVMTPQLRARMGAAAVEAARAINYRGAGTVEFLLDAAQNFYFLEMNTRLQVEHPVTEMVTGLDLVEMQFQVAAGQPLAVAQDDIALNGHAIEVRLYAEDPANDFLPATGRIAAWHVPAAEGIRVDSGVVAGQDISPFYDPMVAKVIAWAPTRDAARLSLIASLRKTRFFGPASNLPFLIDILERPVFAQGEATTAFIADEFGESGFAQAQAGTDLFAVAAVLDFLAHHRAAVDLAIDVPAELVNWGSTGTLANSIDLSSDGETQRITIRATASAAYAVTLGGVTHDIDVLAQDRDAIRLRIDTRQRDILFARTAPNTWQLGTGRAIHTFERHIPGEEDTDMSGQDGIVRSPMHGVLIELCVEEGQEVAVGTRLAVVEAMKMQHDVRAAVAGQVARIAATTGAQVADGALLVEITPQA
ncbi:acetyl-CoA carboxylase biotin carboxylase subunit [Sulfitobacter sp. F26169L]|uniref:acetyl/propionyl/methylcrotonyl-CoA carboxylase subunit alpha n=1 Tax=Sulfitobacter sp. F26169L TaxID=2996015 RepID=UPI002260E0CD|nr:acetyl-CoA carboxylase biotin carboxylase subunit [Sulfitobacter sp. F26169L]MCX7568107.1 acetyl-CoA carboxylase biotin carboxylase subunit [Sulfitobacter sp. F26169L]